MRYGADWAEGPAKNRVDKLPPEGANATEACNSEERVEMRGVVVIVIVIAIVPLRGDEKEVAEEGVGEKMTKSGLLGFDG